MMQLLVPGRHARLSDFVVDTAAVYIGIAVWLAVKWIFPHTFKR